MRVLLAGPYVGEVGWEIMSWQGRVRRLFAAASCDRLVVVGSPGKAAFYADMPLDYRAVELSQLPGQAYEDRRVDGGVPLPAQIVHEAAAPLVDPVEAELVAGGHAVIRAEPGYDGTLWPCHPGVQRFVAYPRELHPGADPTVLLVRRTRAYRSEDNWPASMWDQLAARLQAEGIRTQDYPPEAESAITALNACDLAVGQSTGGMHLAALCRCPRLVWSIERYLWSPLEITNRQRYETYWNPLGSPTIVHEVARLPDLEEAVAQVRSALRTIGRRNAGAWGRFGRRLRWSLRTQLVRHVLEPRRHARWPWPVQRLLREHVL